MARNPNPQSVPLDGAPGTSAVTEGDDEDLFANFQEWFKASRDHWHDWRQEASKAYDFRAGHQWDEEDLETLREQLRPSMTFNRIETFVDTVSGLEIGNRQEAIFLPRQLGSQGKSDLISAAAKWARDECDGEDEESEQFLDAVTCGIGWTATRMEYDTDPDGMVVIERVDPLMVYPDAHARKANLSDMKHVFKIIDVPFATARQMFPEVDEDDLHAQWADDQTDATKDPHNARLAPFYRVDQSGEIDRERQMCRLVEVEWWEYETAWRVLDPSTGRLVQLSAGDYKLFTDRAKRFKAKLKTVRDRKKVFHKAIVGNVILEKFKGAEKGGFSLKAITGKRDRNKATFYGLVRVMMDPQMWANKWLSQVLHILNTNAKGGLLAETTAFENPNQAEDSWADPSAITWLSEGGMGKVQPKPQAQFPQGIMDLMEFAVNSIPGMTGVNAELMGAVERDQPGVVEQHRKQAGMTVLAGLFNNQRRYKKEHGRLLLWLLQTFIADGRLIRIGGAEDAQFVPLIHDPNIGEYDIVVDDTPDSPNMKDKVWNGIIALFPTLSKLNVSPQAMLGMLKYSPFPQTMVNELMQAAAQPPPPPQPKPVAPPSPEEQAVMQAKAGVHQAEAANLQAKTQHMAAQTQIDMMKAQALIEQQRSAAALNLQKAGLQAADQRYDMQMDAVDRLLQAHQQVHDQSMDHAGLAQDQQAQAHAQALAEAQHGLAAQGQAVDQDQAQQALDAPPSPNGGQS